MLTSCFCTKLLVQVFLMKIPLMKRCFALLLGLMICSFSYSQHYYNDIISTQQSNTNYKLLKQANVKQVKGVSYEADNSLTDNFGLRQELSRDKKKLITSSTSTNNVTTVTVSQFENDLIKRTTDTLGTVSNIVDYSYDANGRLSQITTQSLDPDHNGNTSEVHQWFYKENGTPDHMLKIKNHSDTVRVEFSLDEKGNVAEETWKWKNRTLNSYYYYYNDANQLTDIVRYNSKAKKLLPDYIFDYSDGKLSQMTQIIAGTTNYLIWKYTYNESGLKQSEQLLDKNKRIVGRIEYTYSK